MIDEAKTWPQYVGEDANVVENKLKTEGILNQMVKY